MNFLWFTNNPTKKDNYKWVDFNSINKINKNFQKKEKQKNLSETDNISSIKQF